jgi:hypothetical protein
MEATAAARLGAGDALDHGLDLVRVAWRLAPCTPAEQQLADNGLINVAPEQSLTPACARRRGRSPSRPGRRRCRSAAAAACGRRTREAACVALSRQRRPRRARCPAPRSPHAPQLTPTQNAASDSSGGGGGGGSHPDQATPKDGVLAELMHEQRLEHWRATGHTASRVPTTDPSSASAISESASTSSSPHPTR